MVNNRAGQSCTENSESFDSFLTGFLKRGQKNKMCKLTVAEMLTKITNIGFLIVPENEVNELILIANNNPQRLKQFIYAINHF